MEPELARFESTYKSKINLVNIDVDETGTPEFQKYGDLMRRSPSIPFTLWVDSKGNVLREERSVLSTGQLTQTTEIALQMVGKAPATPSPR